MGWWITHQMFKFDCLILPFAIISTSENKPAAVLEHSADLEIVEKKRKKKKKKKRQREEESRWCSDGPDDETETVEPPSKKCATDDAKTSKKAAGTRAGSFSRASV